MAFKQHLPHRPGAGLFCHGALLRHAGGYRRSRQRTRTSGARPQPRPAQATLCGSEHIAYHLRSEVAPPPEGFEDCSFPCW